MVQSRSFRTKKAWIAVCRFLTVEWSSGGIKVLIDENRWNDLRLRRICRLFKIGFQPRNLPNIHRDKRWMRKVLQNPHWYVKIQEDAFENSACTGHVHRIPRNYFLCHRLGSVCSMLRRWYEDHLSIWKRCCNFHWNFECPTIREN